MKKSLLALIVCIGTAVASFAADGGFVAANVGSGANGTTVNAPVFDTNGTTPLSGPGFLAQFYAGTVGTPEGSLQAIGTPIPFLTGGFAGYFSGGTVTVPGVAIGQMAALQLRAWNTASGATWELATIRGNSTAFTSPALGDPLNASTLPVPQGLTSFNLVVPEPSTIALGVIGGLVLLFRRRK